MKRRFIDEKGRLFGVISLIDVLVVLIVLMLAVAVYVRFFTNDTTSVDAANDKFTVEFKISGVRTDTVNAFKAGDKVFEKVNGIYLGTVKDVSSEKSMSENALSDGTRVYGENENRFDVILTVESDGLVSDGHYFASRTYEMNINDALDIYTKYCSVTALIWDIK